LAGAAIYILNKTRWSFCGHILNSDNQFRQPNSDNQIPTTKFRQPNSDSDNQFRQAKNARKFISVFAQFDRVPAEL